MTSTPKPHRAPLTAAEYQTLRQLEDDIAALKAARAPVAEIGHKVAELKRGGLWRREYKHPNGNPGYMYYRFTSSWEKYCLNYLPYTRRYADQTIRLAGETIGSQNGHRAGKPGTLRDLSKHGSLIRYNKTKAAKLTLAQKNTVEGMAQELGMKDSELIRLALKDYAISHDYLWPE